MKADGIIRRFDDLGRINIPKEIRRQLFGKPEKSEGMPMEIFIDKDTIVIRKCEENEADDVCDWKYSSITGNWDSDRHKKVIKDAIACDWKVCPYCGKKIKVVE